MSILSLNRRLTFLVIKKYWSAEYEKNFQILYGPNLFFILILPPAKNTNVEFSTPFTEYTMTRRYLISKGKTRILAWNQLSEGGETKETEF